MRLIFVLIFSLLVAGCDFTVPGADEKFGQQNFVSAVSLIELHKTRNGVYPESLKELKYLGDWDGIWLAAVRYEKVDKGYNLFVERGWVGKPNLEFPIGFKQGLGLQESNVKWIEK
ncbi:MAG TPA: hypothetical protein VIF82_17820 [Burkholderiaceae bacterium]|jgi:hypothetical protein